MHVLSIAPSFSTTGVSVHVDQINRHLLNQGHRVIFAPLSVEQPCLVRCWEEQCVEQPVPFRAGGKDWFSDKMSLVDAYVDEICRMELPEPVQVIHSHDWLAALAGARLAKRLGCPHLATIHTLAEIQRLRCGLPGRLPAHLGQIALEEQLCRAPDVILTVSQAMKRLILEIGRLATDGVKAIPNGVDVQRFAAAAPAAVAELRQRLAPKGERLVLFVGRLAPQKGVEFLLRSTYLVQQQLPATRWVMVGDHVAAYMMKPVYEQVMREGGYRDHLHFEGEVPWDDMPLYYHAADCLVMPSLFEACPYVLLEAMAAGTCVIASDLESLHEPIVHDQNGLLVPIEEGAPIQGPVVSALARAQLEVLTDPALRGRLTDAARKTVEQHFTLAGQLKAVSSFYERVQAGWARGLFPGSLPSRLRQ